MASVRKTGPAWWVIFFWVIVFWPVGLGLLYRKLIVEKTAVLRNSKPLGIFGWIFLMVGVTQAPTMFADTQAGGIVVFLLFFFGGGLAMIIGASKMKAMGERYRRYIQVVANQHLMSIDRIAAAIPVRYEQAVEDLQKMIDAGFFEGAYLDLERRELIMPTHQMTHVDTCAETAAAISIPSVEIVGCRRCGANNTIRIGSVRRCEYCGSPLE